MENPFGSALWIASSVAGGARTSPPAPFFRQPFHLPKPVRTARLTITALGLYQAEINGKPVGDHVFAPGWTEYTKQVPVQTYEVGTLLRRGENTLGVILGEGWYSGAIGWHDLRQHYGERPQFVARLQAVMDDGAAFEILTDKNWKTAIGPILENDFLMGEAYDARLELGEWSLPGYDDRNWTPVLQGATPKIESTRSEAPPVRRTHDLKPVGNARIFHHHGLDVRVFDFGQNFSGRVRLSLRAARGVTAALRFAEILNPDGTLYTDNLRGARSTDVYTCRGEGLETWEPHFTFHGFRYVEVRGVPREMEVQVIGVVLHSDMRPIGRFACSNHLLHQLQNNIVWSQRSNFIDVPTDYPQRDERLGWTGDAQVFIRTAAFNMHVGGFFRKWARDIRDTQSAEGAVPPVVPQAMGASIPWEDGGPAWSDATVICPWTIYLCYNDRKILEDHYESMVRYMAFLGRKRSLGHIRSHPKIDSWGGYGDWLAPSGGGKPTGATPPDLIGTAFYAYDAEIMAQIAGVLGRKNEARHFHQLHAKIVTAFRNRFVTLDGLLVSGTQTSYVLALRFGLLPQKARAKAAAYLANDVEKRGYHLATGFVGTPYILGVLAENGYLETAYKLLEQETFPSWLFPVKNGATTIWERWDGWTPEKGPQDKNMNSFNHYAYGAVGEWMYSAVAGLDLDPKDPGYRHILFRPRPGGTLTWAEAELESAFGINRLRWEKTRVGLKVELTIPQGAHGTLVPPEGYGRPRKLRAGRHGFTLRKAGGR